MIGKTISHYKILDKLGEGGMGVVYKAEDTKLERTVALKFLFSTAITGDEEKKRFKREAKAAASLNHPNIATIFAIDEAEGKLFIAMEFIEGKSLEELVGANGGKPMPMDKAIDYATQISAGLQAAHEKGIVHRDIKSANVMITDKGVVKIMDFGLAKLTDRSKMTQEGTTLGTPSYMSPEQALGETVDHRSDVWSLGVVLYEMISGQLPFKGDYEQAVVYSIMNENPEPITGLRTGVPMELERIVDKAMAKDPDERYQHVEEIAVDLKSVKASTAKPSGISTTTPRTRTSPSGLFTWVVPWSIAVLMAVLALIASWKALEINRGSEPSATRLSITLPSNQNLVVTGRSYPLAVSPNGKHLAYVAQLSSKKRLYLRSFDRFEPQEISGSDGAHHPFFSPDGRWVGFFADGALKKASVAGGKPIRICDAALANFGASWGPDNTIVFANMGAGLMWVSANGGRVDMLTTLGRFRQHWPHFLPGGKEVMFTTGGGQAQAGASGIGILTLDTGKWHLFPDENGMQTDSLLALSSGKVLQTIYIPTGHLVYGLAGEVRVIPFDLGNLKLSGSAVSILDNVYEAPSLGAVYFAVSHNGSLVYVPGGTQHSLMWVDRQGRPTRLIDERGAYRFPRLSPDGNKMTATIDADPDPSDIWLFDLERSMRTRLTTTGHNIIPAWTPDGVRIAFYCDDDIYWTRVDGGSEPEPLLQRKFMQLPHSWSPDGRFLAFTESHPSTGWDIWILPLGRESTPYLVTTFNENVPRFSPDGRWIAYVSDESGRNEVFVRPFPGPGSKQLVSTTGGTEPSWSLDGRELFYRHGNRMMVMEVETKPTFRAGEPRLLFEGGYDARHPENNYDVFPDGQKFVMIKLDEKATPTQFNVVLNWFEDLKRRIPEGK